MKSVRFGDVSKGQTNIKNNDLILEKGYLYSKIFSEQIELISLILKYYLPRNNTPSENLSKLPTFLVTPKPL